MPEPTADAASQVTVEDCIKEMESVEKFIPAQLMDTLKFMERMSNSYESLTVIATLRAYLRAIPVEERGAYAGLRGSFIGMVEFWSTRLHSALQELQSMVDEFDVGRFVSAAMEKRDGVSGTINVGSTDDVSDVSSTDGADMLSTGGSADSAAASGIASTLIINGSDSAQADVL